MTDYITGQWYGWNGEQCPVHPKTRIDITLPHGFCVYKKCAVDFNWSEPLLFRIVTPYVEPEPKLECWVNVYHDAVSYHEDQDTADECAHAGRIRCVRMIEADEQ